MHRQGGDGLDALTGPEDSCPSQCVWSRPGSGQPGSYQTGFSWLSVLFALLFHPCWGSRLMEDCMFASCSGPSVILLGAPCAGRAAITFGPPPAWQASRNFQGSLTVGGLELWGERGDSVSSKPAGLVGSACDGWKGRGATECTQLAEHTACFSPQSRGPISSPRSSGQCCQPG